MRRVLSTLILRRIPSTHARTFGVVLIGPAEDVQQAPDRRESKHRARSRRAVCRNGRPGSSGRHSAQHRVIDVEAVVDGEGSG